MEGDNREHSDGSKSVDIRAVVLRMMRGGRRWPIGVTA